MSIRTLCVAVAGLWLTAGQEVGAQSTTTNPLPWLWHAADDEPRRTETPCGVVEDRTVVVDPQVVNGLAVGSAVQLLLPGDIIATARLTEEKSATGKFRGFEGRIDNDPFGSITMVCCDNLVVASIRTRWHGLVQVRRDHEAYHVVQQVDETRLPQCGTDHSHHVGGPSTGSQSNNPNDDGTVFDILVVWTNKAQNAAGGMDAINAVVDLAFIETNTAYEDSGVNSRIRLVYKSKIGYDESSDFGGHLSRLRSKTDGWMDDVHAIRDAVGADQVALLVKDGQYCGIAYLMTQLSHNFEDDAFSVTNWSCATGYYSFGHELGHNQGCHHDHDNGSGALFPYSYGYRFYGNSGTQWRTMLAYSPGSRIARLSNPNETFDGVATGVHGTGPDAANNARSLNEAASTVANWRNEGLQPTSIIFSTRLNEALNGTTYSKADFILLNLATGNFSMFIDMSDLIAGNINVTGLVDIGNDEYLVTFADTVDIPGLTGGPNGTTVEPQDVVRLTVTQYGSTSAGSFSFEFDGSDVGLDDAKEAIDALSIANDGDLVMSFEGPFDLGGGLTGKDEDLVRFNGTSYGASTSGSFTLLFDGNVKDARLGNIGEDVDAFHLDSPSGSWTVSTTGNFRVPAARVGEDDDLIAFLPTSIGVNTAGLWMNILDGGFYGLEGADIDAVHLRD